MTIFSLGIFRDYLYSECLVNQPSHPLLLEPIVKYASIPLFLFGNVLVLTSMYALGLTGTYLGDYFGILMDAPVVRLSTTIPPPSQANPYHRQPSPSP